jgi:hypothetical protein
MTYIQLFDGTQVAVASGLTVPLSLEVTMENRKGSREQEQVTHTSVERKDGDRLGFTGGENLQNAEEFAGRENVTEERQHRALDPQDDVEQRGR